MIHNARGMKINILAWMVAALMLLLALGTLGATQAAASSSYYGEIVASSLNVREDAAKDAEVRGSVKKGDIVLVTKEFHGWLEIKHGSLEGWVAGYYVQKTDKRPGKADNSSSKPATASTASSASKSSSSSSVVLVDALRIREGPSTDHKVTGMLYRGAPVSIRDSVQGWLQIVSGDERGWVSSQYIGEGTAVTSNLNVTQTSTSSGGTLRGKVIVIDPGHGGSDPGMVGTTYKTAEKTINLSTANYLKEQLQSLGAKVVMTRTKDDQKPELPRRVAISHEAGADAFISIHYNSSEKNNSGILTFFYSDRKDKPLAHAIERQLAGGIGLKSHGVAFGDYHVLRENRTPAVLLELGFLSNSRDEGIVKGSDYQQKAARAIAKGLQNYFK